ncbi:MAG: Fe-S cluster assembly protein SufD [Bacteroidota bacterium]
MNTAKRGLNKDTFIDYFQEASAQQASNGISVRNSAVSLLKELDFPDRKNEAWKYTQVKRMLNLPAVHPEGLPLEDITPFLIPELEADRLVFINQSYVPSLSSLNLNGDKVHVAPLSALTDITREVFEANFGEVLSADWDLFAATNTAFAHEGVVAYIPRNTILPYPIQIIHLSESKEGTVGIQHRNLFLAGDGAEGKIIETFHSLGETSSSLRVHGTEVMVGKNAGLEHVRLQLESSQSSIIDRTEVHQATDSRYHIFTLTFNGDLIRNSLVVRLKGQNTHTDMMGAYLLDGEQHLDNWTQIHHEQPNCYSNELYKGMVDQEASAAFTGKIHVYQPAQKTNAYQSNRNILLSDTANVYTKPQLEIYADDVKCSHGATTGRIDRDALFYLMARGIPEHKARMMMIHAFVMEVADYLSLEAVKSYVDGLVEKKFNG